MPDHEVQGEVGGGCGYGYGLRLIQRFWWSLERAQNWALSFKWRLTLVLFHFYLLSLLPLLHGESQDEHTEESAANRCAFLSWLWALNRSALQPICARAFHLKLRQYAPTVYFNVWNIMHLIKFLNSNHLRPPENLEPRTTHADMQ